MDAPPATYFLSKRRALDRFRTTAPLYTGQFHRAVRRGDRATLDLVADGFARIPETERQEIEYRWYGRSLRQVGWTDILRQFAPYIAAVLGGGVLLLAWTWTLHRQVAARTRRLSEALGNLTESEERFRAIVDNVSDAIFIHDADTGAIVFVNRRMREMYGIGTRPLDSIDVGTLSEGSPPYSLAEARGWMERALRGETPVFDWHARRLDGETFWVEVGIRHARIGPHHRLLVVVRDISERMAHQERLQQLAHHDALTGLPNRLLLTDRAQQAMLLAARAGQKVALVFCDLDQFKTINDSLGHHAGDTLIREAARRLTGCIRHADTIGRMGGDEFIALLGGITDAEEAGRIVQKLHEAIARPFEVDGQEITATLSSGIALFPDDGDSFGALLKRADTAMHQAKAEGRNTHRFFTERMNQDSLGRLTMRNGLRRALEKNEFVLHYQPQAEIASGSIVGVEALLRWVSPDRGLVPPAAFIPNAEDSGLIVPIGEWVLREACRQAAEWNRDGDGPSVAVNISAVQFHRPGLEETVLAALADSGLPPRLLELELTESVLLHDTEAALARVRRLGELGLKLSIDDFGTGYSSLAYIRSLQVDKLKIDRSFVREVAANAGSAAIVAAIIQMSHSLGLTAVAEGVESEEELAFLRGQGCDIVQGYLIARPLPADQLVLRAGIPPTTPVLQPPDTQIRR